MVTGQRVNLQVQTYPWELAQRVQNPEISSLTCWMPRSMQGQLFKLEIPDSSFCSIRIGSDDEEEPNVSERCKDSELSWEPDQFP